MVRPPRFPRIAVTGSHSLSAGLVLGMMALAAGVWGYAVEDPDKQSALEAVTYFLLPLLVLLTVAASMGRRPRPILCAVALLDVEAALLGAGPLIALPFVVAVPLIGVSVAARLVKPSNTRLLYLTAWAASSTGVTVAVLQIVDIVEPSALVVIPAFMLVDALALAMLWYVDSRRLSALDAVAGAESRVRDLLNGVDLVALGVGNDSRLDLVNDFTLRLTGWTREEVIGADWWDTFATPERREAARANYTRIIAERSSMDHQRESVILTKDGGRRLIRWSHVTRHDAQGRVAGVVSLGEDITAIRAAEDAARRQSEMLSRLVVSSPLATVVLALDRTVQLWNPAAADLLGWTEAEVVGRPLPAELYGSDRWAVARSYAAALKGKPMDHGLLELRRRDGGLVNVRLYGGVLLDLDGMPTSVGLQVVDVTEALAMENQLREAQKMEAIGRLAGGVAHDFNNSLTAIGGFAALIASGSKEPETRESAETILVAAKRAADLTRELLAYSRRSLLQPQVVEVNSLIGSIRPMLLRGLREDVSLVIESRASEALIRVDPSGLERVILNLAANARDAMPAGGRLEICTDRRSREASDDANGPGWVTIAVSDTGAGIPPSVQSKVFDPFFTTKPVGSGTGLGLSMVKGFVVQSGGKVDLRSEPGRGTTIEISLPEVPGTRKPAAAEPSSQIPAGGDETILVVDDEPAVAGVSFQVLTRHGYRVLLADSGESALGLLRGHGGRIALMIVDAMLPDMRGPDLVALARPLHPESSVLFASG